MASNFLDGCGVEYVHWIPAPARKCRPEEIAETPLLAFQAPGCLRIQTALMRNKISSWEMLAAVSREKFAEWRNYGEKSHARLVAVANANGYLIETWR